MKTWSARWGWQTRILTWEAEVDYARRAEMVRQAEAQARENAKLIQQVGAGLLAVAAVKLNCLVDSKTGELVGDVHTRDLPALSRTGAELLQLSLGQPTSIVGVQDATSLEQVLREAPEETRTVVLAGMRAALSYIEQQNGEGQAS